MKDPFRKGLTILLLFGCVTLPRILLLDRVPGLNGDEAMAGLKAYEILTGKGDLFGLVSYTGGLYELALAPFILAFGNTLLGLRLFPVLIGILTIWIIYSHFRKYLGGSLAFWGTLALGTSPLWSVTIVLQWTTIPLCFPFRYGPLSCWMPREKTRDG